MVGPAVFIVAWAALGASAEGYDPTRQAISRLAAFGAPTRPAMTAALAVLGLGMVLYGLAVRPGPARPLPVANGLATLAVAALPLGGRYDTAHGVVAAAGYVTLAAIPVVLGSGRSRLVGLVCGACLLASVLLDRDGLLQRLGLTVGHVWVMVNAVALVRSPRSWSTIRQVRAPAGRRR